ncbi:MAG: Nif3-like dinuclear metal center hexameric protein [Candidatus Latescibacteria bacterium]|nr:Nif3-like dinuclear metal center hexameric protein [bacterium]MBD3425459.1 Nif3-like dinuclear metal center hexameric protein [Candidatus Latescibacterota bacterium]
MILLLTTLTEYLDQLLRIDEFSSIDASLNGLQVEGAGRVNKISLAVDGCRASISKAARNRSDMLIVHHGLFWGDQQPVTGIMKKRLELLIRNGISLYAAHLPLDAHPSLGNNARLAEMLELNECGGFGEYGGREIGVMGDLTRKITPSGLARKIGKILSTRVELFDFGKPRIKKLAIVSGSGASLAGEAEEAGCDALLTGERSHSVYHSAYERGITLLCAGHYATETVGIKAVGQHLAREFKLDTLFLDIPTGV